MNTKTATRMFYTILIVFLIVILLLNSNYLNKYLEDEHFQNLRKYFLFHNYKKEDNPNCQSRLLNLQHSLSRRNDIHNKQMPHIDANYNTNSNNMSLLNLIDINPSALGYINRLVQIKFGSLCLVPNNKNELELRNVKLDTSGYEASTFKIVLGLSDPEYISFYHIATDKYICRDADGKLFLGNFELVDEKARNIFSFRLCQGIVNLDKVIISCPRIYKETLGRVWCVENDSLIKYKLNPRMQTIDNIKNNNINNCEFGLVDVHSGVVLGNHYLGQELHNTISDNIDRTMQATGIPADEQEPYGLQIPKFFNNSNTMYSSVNNNVNNVNNIKEGFEVGMQFSKGNKLRDMISSVIGGSNNNLISRHEINKLEVFPEMKYSNSLYNSHSHKQKEAFINGADDALDANTDNDVESKLVATDVFRKITGGNAEAILNVDLEGKNYAEVLSDKLMEKLQKAKLDPNVQSLLDYNEKMYNIYKAENMEYENKLQEHLDEHVDNVDKRIRQANNYRVGQMAKELYNLENILNEKRKTNLD